MDLSLFYAAYRVNQPEFRLGMCLTNPHRIQTTHVKDVWIEFITETSVCSDHS